MGSFLSILHFWTVPCSLCEAGLLKSPKSWGWAAVAAPCVLISRSLHSSAFADRDRGLGETRKQHNGIGAPHTLLCKLPSVHVTTKCHLPYLITCHTPFYWYELSSMQNSVKPGPAVCSDTIFQVCASTSVCLEKFK